MLSKKIPAVYLLPIVGVSVLSTYFVSRNLNQSSANDESNSSSLYATNSCSMDVVRLKGYQYIKPLMFTEKQCESEKLIPIRQSMESIIQQAKATNTIQSASVYLRQLNEGDWTAINPDEKYLPGSLMKVPELITFMKMHEKDPGLFDRQYKYEKPFTTDKKAYFTSKSIEIGKSYSVKELMKYMITYSDNNATIILNSIMPAETFSKVFTDLGMAKPDLKANDIPISVRDYSRFMRTIFNSTYLSFDDSEFCSELLCTSDFSQGLRKGIPDNIKVAHKFGEAGNAASSFLGESGIVFYGDKPYLLTVMVRGKNKDLLPGVIADLSQTAFNQITKI
ncbi:MAG TPA: class A beta-lactamase-related serine hydrolase [Ferruginibacter sp.]|nr:class A beta-lactamase-related serine hydrolase [Ferruginibacter sp.]